MIVVTGHLTVEPRDRAAYLESCREVVAQARRAPGCLDFAVGADLVDPGRVNVAERWVDRPALEAFRAGGPSGDQQQMIRAAAVDELDV